MWFGVSGGWLLLSCVTHAYDSGCSHLGHTHGFGPYTNSEDGPGLHTGQQIQICFFRSSWWFTGEKEANTISFRAMLKKENLEYIIHYILYSSVNSILIFKTRSLSCVQILFTRCYMHIHFFASFSVAHSCSSSSSESSVQPLPPSLFFLLLTPFLPPTGR